MTTNRSSIVTLACTLALAAAPALAQRGGIGVGVGGAGVQVGTGSQAGVGAQAGGARAGVGANTDIQAGVQGKSGAEGNSKSQAPSGPDFVSRIEGNTQLANRVQAMLPSGESLSDAAAGFKNEGQFLAALHASHNLDIPFDQLKTRMTGSNSTSLGGAIKALKPEMTEAQSKEQAKKAESQAKTTASAKAKTSTTSTTAAAQ